MKRILNISFWVLGISGFLFFEFYSLRQYGETNCKSLDIELDTHHDYPLLTSEKEINTELLENHMPLVGQKLKNLDLHQIEKEVSQIAYLDHYNAYFSIDGKLSVQANPRKAIVRVYNQVGQHFYLGADTVLMPLSNKHSLRLLLANGNLPRLPSQLFRQSRNEHYELPSIYKKIFILASKIQEDEFLKALIDQIYVEKNGEFELIPKAGVGYIEFGTLENSTDKLKRLKYFYINGKKKINWNIYKSISLKYKNQVVCTKK
jgi:cell division protein FtsQ